MKKAARSIALLSAAGLTGCATPPSPAELDRRAAEIIHSSFRDQGIATVDRLNQDAVQKACSDDHAPPPALARSLEAAELATVRWPADGAYLGDWREGERLAQNGRGMTWSDAPGAPSGGNCYNCHQIGRTEISYGTLGPSLYGYGRLRGITDPAAPASAAVLRATWAKLWNAKASNLCSSMPRFGQAGVLTAAQLRDLMALLLDPKSPVNQ